MPNPSRSRNIYDSIVFRSGAKVKPRNGGDTVDLEDIVAGAVETAIAAAVAEEAAKIRTARQAVTVAGSSVQEITVAWPTALPDGNFTVIAQVETAEGALGTSLMATRIVSRSPEGIVVAVANESLSSLSGTLHVVAVRDAGA